MRRTLVVLAMSAIMVLSTASVAFAGNGYGKAIQDACGVSMGQLIGPAKKAGTDFHDNYKGGAKALVAVAAAHGCG